MPIISKPSNLNLIWAATGTKVDPGQAKTTIGWVVQLPPYEYQNWVDNRQDTAIAHFNQRGVPEWDVNTEYQGNLSYVQASNGIVYKCIRTHTGLDPANSNNSSSWVRAFEEYGSVQLVQSALNAHLNNYAGLSGLGNVVLARSNLSVYSKAETDARYAFKAGDADQPFLVGVATQPSHAVQLSQLGSIVSAASETVSGTTRYATTQETEAGTIDNKAVTPLKGATIYLKKSANLAGLPNVVTARSNLGLGTIAVEAAGSFLRGSNNFSDVPNKPVARANLGLTSTATLPETYFLRVGNNLADIPDKAAARANLGITPAAELDTSNFLFKSENLAGLANVGAARGNLGLADSATIPSNNFMWRGNNLADLSNVQSARNNLQLGNLATMNAYGQNGANLDFTSNQADFGWMNHPNGIVECWGRINIEGSGEVSQLFPKAFPRACWNIQLTNVENYPNEGNTIRVRTWDANGFTVSMRGNGFTQYFFRAIGN